MCVFSERRVTFMLRLLFLTLIDYVKPEVEIDEKGVTTPKYRHLGSVIV